ncbi:MAG: hypothetical protein KDB03_26870 [Planctomycetales bacterium]|nr:hypothetical protein [Planctomycetales bacterium]
MVYRQFRHRWNKLSNESATLGHSRSRRRPLRDRSHRSVTLERMEDRRLLAGLDFDSLILASSDTTSVYSNVAAVDNSGNTYMSGRFLGTMDFDSNATHPGNADVLTARGYADAFVAKYDSQGAFLWVRRMGGDSPDLLDDGATQIALDDAGNLIVGGSFAGSADFGSMSLNSTGDTDAFAAKLDSNGNFLWATGWGTEFGESIEQLVVGPDGKVTTAMNAPIGSAENDVELRQFSASGNLLWTAQFESNSTGRSSVTSFRCDTNGNLFIAGGFRGSTDFDPGVGEYVLNGPEGAPTKNSYVAKFTVDGDLIWADSFVADTQSEPSSTAYIDDIEIAGDGNVAIIGHYKGLIIDQNSEQFLPSSSDTATLFAKLSAVDGDAIMTQTYNGSLTLGNNSPLVASPKGFFLAGNWPPTNPSPSVSFLNSMGGLDIVIIALDENGDFVSAGLVGGSGTDQVTGILSDANGDAFVTGWSSSPVADYDPSPTGTHLVNNPSNADSFILKLVPNESVELFADSFEVSEWNGLWVEDSQNDWFRSTQRATDGSFAAEVDGSANNATLTIASSIDMSGLQSAELTFDWLIESGFDAGEYLSLDISTNGGATWIQDVRRLNGNVSPENVWHNEVVDLTPYLSASTKIRFRSKVSASDEDANVDNVRITGIPGEIPNAPPIVDAGPDLSLHDGDGTGAESFTLLGSATDSDGSIVAIEWTEGTTFLGSTATISSTLSVGVHILTLTATDNEGAASSDTVMINVLANQAPTANAGTDISVYDSDKNGNEVVVLDGSGSDADGNIVSYQWSNNNTVIGNSANLSVGLPIGTHVLTLTVTDNGGATSSDTLVVTISEPPTETPIYVYDIRFESGSRGRVRAVFEIRSDSNRDGIGNSADDPAAGVAITVQFAGQTFTGITDANGIFRTNWLRNVSAGSYAEVVDMVWDGYFWDPLSLDLEDDSDGNGRPDAIL